MSYSFAIALQDYASSGIMKITQQIENMQGKIAMGESKIAEANTKAYAGLTELNAKMETSKSLAGSLRGAFGSMVGMLGAIGVSTAFIKIGQMMSEGKEKAHELHQAEAQIRAGLESTKGVAGMTYEAIEASAKKLSSSTLVGRSDILSMQSVLLTFPAVTKETFDQVSQLSLDMSTRLGQDFKNSSIQIGKAMTDPVKGARALRRVGVMLTDDQEALIAKYVESGEKLKAQQVIMKELQTEFGGSAKAAFDADPLAKYNKMIGKLKLSLGESAIKIQASLAPALMGIGKGLAWLAEHIPPVVVGFIDIVKWVLACKPLLIGVGVILAGLALNFVIANAAQWAYSIGLGILNGALWLTTAAQTALNVVMSMNPISLVIIAIGALIVIVAALWNRFGWLRGAVLGVWEVIKGLGTMIKNYVINRFQELLSGIQGVGSALVAFFKGDFAGAMAIGAQAGKNLLGFGSAEKATKDGLDAFKSFHKGWEEGNKSIPKTAQKVATGTPKSPLKFNPFGPGGAGDGDDDKDKDGKDKKDGKEKKHAETINGGGSKMTNITVNINKLQDDTKIYVSSADAGTKEAGDKVQEMLLRAINSVNQMQTA